MSRIRPSSLLPSLFVRIALVGSALLAGAGGALAAQGQDLGPLGLGDVVPGQLLVRFAPELEAAEIDVILEREGLEPRHRYRLVPNLRLVGFSEKLAMEAQIEALEALPEVRSAEPDRTGRLLTNDPDYPGQWPLENTGQTTVVGPGTPGEDIRANDAWTITTGGSGFAIGVIDTGLLFEDAEFSNMVWKNPGEIAGNGQDDDGNGYVDDIHGIAPAFNWPIIYPPSFGFQANQCAALPYGARRTRLSDADPCDWIGHGTNVSSIIAGGTNNGKHRAGVLFGQKTVIPCSMMPVESQVLECLDYFHDLKTRPVNPINIIATNNSYGFAQGQSQAFTAAIAAHMAADILFIAGAGNSTNDNDAFPQFPANTYLPNVVSVGAISADGKDWIDPNVQGFGSGSNYGLTTVDLWAPGDDIVSGLGTDFFLGGGQRPLSGSSYATAYVSGVAGLIHADDPTRDFVDLRNLLLAGGEPDTQGNPATLSLRKLRAAEISGVANWGSLTCRKQKVVGRALPPGTQVSTGNVSTYDLTVAYLHIRCDQPFGMPAISIQGSDGSQLWVQPLDNGVAPDQLAGDGIFSGQITLPMVNGSLPVSYLVQRPGHPNLDFTVAP